MGPNGRGVSSIWVLGRAQGDLWAWGGSSRAGVGQGGPWATQGCNRTWGYHDGPRLTWREDQGVWWAGVTLGVSFDFRGLFPH